MKILHLIDSLDYSGSARQLQLLAPALAQQDTSVEVCCLGPETPWSASLREAGVTVHTLGWTRWFDFSALWNLRAIIRSMSPDLIHVWRMSALRTLAVVAKGMLPRTVMSAVLPARGKLAWWDRRLLGPVRCVAVAGASDCERCVQQGVAPPQIVLPAVKRCQDPLIEKGPDTFFPFFRIVCVGNLERDEGFRQAVWAFDLVRQVYSHATLQIVGVGSQLDELHALAHGLQNASHVQFLGSCADVTNVLRGADLVWIPSQANCGRQVALDAMALGRPVIASDVPSLRNVIRDGETGFLVPIGDVVAVGRRTHALFQDAGLRQRIGAAAEQFVSQQFDIADVVARWQDVYRSAAA